MFNDRLSRFVLFFFVIVEAVAILIVIYKLTR